MITVKQISKKYLSEGIETQALENVSFQIERGEFVAIMGPSGCGKSTLLNILGLVDVTSEGNYIFNEKDVTNLPENKRASIRRGKIGFVFQSFNLIEDLTVFENVELPLVYQKIPRKERKQKVIDILDKMNIAHRRHHFPSQLSGGQQQRVAVARAVINQPELILADEPTGNLDSVNGEEVMSILSKLNADGTTIIMVTHDIKYTEYANKVIHLFDGHIVAQNNRGVKND